MHDVEAGQAQGAAQREKRRDQRADHAGQGLQRGGIDEDGRRDAERDHVAEAVEFDAEVAAYAHGARDFAVHEVEEHGAGDHPRRGQIVAADGEDQRQHAAEQVAAGDHVGDVVADGDPPEPLAVVQTQFDLFHCWPPFEDWRGFIFGRGRR